MAEGGHRHLRPSPGESYPQHFHDEDNGLVPAPHWTNACRTAAEASATRDRTSHQSVVRKLVMLVDACLGYEAPAPLYKIRMQCVLVARRASIRWHAEDAAGGATHFSD